MKDILEEIIATKRIEVERVRKTRPLETLRIEAEQILKKRHASPASMSRSLMASSSGIIAEFKRRSPSKGWFKEHARAENISPAYAQNGAAALSILTDTPYFGGAADDLRAVRPLTDCPILRKDFIIEAYQVYEAAALGADAILLIAAAIGKAACCELANLAHDLGMEVLLEIHEEHELEYLACQPDMVGINNRHLGTFKTDVDTSFKMSSLLPDNIVKVAESGISSPATVNELRRVGYRGFLIGETFMRTPNPAVALSEFIRSIKS